MIFQKFSCWNFEDSDILEILINLNFQYIRKFYTSEIPMEIPNKHNFESVRNSDMFVIPIEIHTEILICQKL